MGALEWRPDEEDGYEADVTIEGMCLLELSIGPLDEDKGSASWSVHSIGTYDCGHGDTVEKAKADAEAFALELLERGVALLKGIRK
jgi:hypothetical protein